MEWAAGIVTPGDPAQARGAVSLRADGFSPHVHAATGPHCWRDLARDLLQKHPQAEGILMVHEGVEIISGTRDFLSAHAWPASCGAIVLCAPRRYVQRYHVEVNGILRGDFPNHVRAQSAARRLGGTIRTVPKRAGLVKLIVPSWKQHRAIAFPRTVLEHLVQDRHFGRDLAAALRRHRRTLYAVHPAIARRIDFAADPDLLSIARDPMTDCIPPDDVQVSGYSDLAEIVREWAPTLPRDISCIVGVPRSGIVPAAMLALQLHLPLLPIEALISGGAGYRPDRTGIAPRELRTVNGRPLVLDDTVSSGRTICELKNKIKTPVYYGAIWARPAGRSQVDFWACDHAEHHLWQWNWWATREAERLACDLDGVLCDDWRGDEECQPERYQEHLSEARPLYLPRVQIQAIVTSRFERYRPHTEAWLQRHGVRYGKLIMEPDGAPRRFAAYKAEIYQRLRAAQLFVESSLAQAAKIHQLTGRPVLSIERFQFFRPR